MPIMLDIEALLAPVPGPAACGQDMLFSAQFDAIQAARIQDDPSLDQGEWVIDLKEANWPFVVAESQKLLRDSSKDLRLAVWLADALAAQHGIAGLDQGYRLLSGLCERWWESLHPLIEDGDLDMRIGCVSWLASRSVSLVRRAALVDDGQQRYDIQAWDAALGLEQALKRGASNVSDLARGKVTLEQFDRVRRATPGRLFRQSHSDIVACEASVTHFEQVFDERSASQGPSFAPVREALASLRETVERFAREAGVSLSAGPVVGPPAIVPEAVARDRVPARIEPVLQLSPDEQRRSVSAPAPREGVHSRTQAIAQLREVADFFERTEPSSPTAYLAKKAALWADMPLHAWLRHVVKNEGELAQLEDMLGIPARAPGESR